MKNKTVLIIIFMIFIVNNYSEIIIEKEKRFENKQNKKRNKQTKIIIKDKITKEDLKERSHKKRIKNVLKKICQEHNISYKLIESMVQVESNFNPYAVSHKGAKGLMQLMPATANAYRVSNVFNIYENLNAGVKYFKYLYGRFDRNLHLALAAYNAGPTAVLRYNNIPPYRETKNYVKKIIKLYKKKGGNRNDLESELEVYKEDGGVIITNKIKYEGLK